MTRSIRDSLSPSLPLQPPSVPSSRGIHFQIAIVRYADRVADVLAFFFESQLFQDPTPFWPSRACGVPSPKGIFFTARIFWLFTFFGLRIVYDQLSRLDS